MGQLTLNNVGLNCMCPLIHGIFQLTHMVQACIGSTILWTPVQCLLC